MSLRDRLEAAKAQRRQQAGLPAEEPDGSPMFKPIEKGSRSEPRADSPEIDLTGYAPVVDLRPELFRREGPPSFAGALVVSDGDSCPNCATDGRLDMEDVAGGVDHYSCPNCGLLYQVAR